MNFKSYIAVFFIVSLFLFLATGCLKSKNKAVQKAGTGNRAEKYSEYQLLDTVQYQTFQFFWDGAEPNSGMTYERLNMDSLFALDQNHTLTIGGTGFGLMAILVGIEHGFITRDEAVARYEKITGFLKKADRFHGVWPHWVYKETGKVEPFSKIDEGADLVETAFLMQGFLTVAEYFKNGNEAELKLVSEINRLWEEVEWDWFTKGGEDVLYWHWSPNHGWEMNFQLRGYNECMITYILAASSPTHPIKPDVYDKGWAGSGSIVSDNTYYGLPTVLKHSVYDIPVGPLFWAHYSFLGLNPRGLSDKYADYWKLTQNHALIQYRYALDNPKKFKGYGENQWGLSSSWSVKGYAGHHPGNSDLGVITPTAALSSFPYTPEESMKFLKYLYYDADSLVGRYGPYDAYSVSSSWHVHKYLAVDQGPIPVMIENYRTGLLWNLFMNNADVKNGLKNLGFTQK